MYTHIFNTILFVTLAASALFLWWRRRDSASAWLAGAWGSLGVAVLVGLVLPQASGRVTGWHEWVTKLGVVLPLVLYPYCFLRFAASFDRRRIISRVAAVLTLVVAVSMLAFPFWPTKTEHPLWLSIWTVGFFLQWVGLSVLAAFRLWRAGRTEPTVTRRRMQLLSVGAITLSAVVLLPLLAQSSGFAVRMVSAAMVFVAAGCVLVGLNPPASVRLVWRRSEHSRMYEMQHALIGSESRAAVADAVLPVLTELLGCGAAAMLDEDGGIVAAEGSDEDVQALIQAAARQQHGSNRTRVVHARLGSGALMAQTGRYAPVFGTDEVRLFESTSLMVDSALSRIESRDELARAHDRALETSRLKSEFLANMSHEIRTPINGVIGLTELLSGTKQNEEQRAYTATIQSSADALLSVLNDILDFSKIEAGKLDFNDSDFDVRSAVEDIVALLAGAANGKHIELAMTVDEDVPAAVRGDVGRVRQVLLNLAGNAVKFTDTGEVVIRVSRVPVAVDVGAEELSAAGDGDPSFAAAITSTRCRFEVTDSGPGISAEALAALFESFSQADSSSSRRHGGTGLGLAISKRLVELMGGSIGVDTEIGRGSSFWFELELVPASTGWTPDPSADVLRDRSVLVVDDNATNRTILVQTAKGWRLEVVAVGDVDHALVELARRHDAGGRFDLAWIDHQMPGRNGTELAQEMAADERFRDTWRILLTSSGDRSGLDEGVLHAHLTKPVRPSVLLDCVAQLLSVPEAVTMAAEAAAPTPEPVRAEQTEPERSPAEQSDPHRCVLVAEDNLVSQQVARRMLESLGCTVDIAATGGEVLAAARQRPYGLVFMDCQMPEMDGYEATAELRAREGEARHTPVVALTASAMKGDAERCLQAGMDDYLTKPVRIADFRAALTRWLPTPPEPAAEPVVDLTALAAVTDTDEESGVLVELFVTTAPVQLERMRSAVAAGDPRTVRRVCHELRGSALYLGALHLAERCAALEAEGDEGPADPSTQLQAIEHEVDRAAQFLLNRFPAAREPAGVSLG